MAAARGSVQSASSGTGSPGSQPGSPPQYQMDQLSLTEHMNANKQVLNRKLMVRRSVHELVDAGIYPTSPHAFAGQRIHLERAKTGDILKHKIEQRPDRDFLVQHHILDGSKVDPSLQSMQRKLKKAKLSDTLNVKLAQRPGPLELVEQKILEVEAPIKAAIEEGKLEFHKTDEAVEPSVVEKLPYEVVSPKSSPDPSDSDDLTSSANNTSGTNPPRVPSPPDISPLLQKPNTSRVTIGGKTVAVPITTQPFLPPAQLTTVSQPYPSQSRSQQPSSSLSNRHNRRSGKHSRPKQQAKQRVIKFHEYKGPPTSKSSSSSSVGSFVTTTGPMQKLDGLTPHQMRVHQQNLYLQCQIEIETKSPGSTVLVPIKTAPTTPLMMPPTDLQEIREPPTPKQSDPTRSRPETPSLSLKSPTMIPVGNPHSSLHVSRSLSHLEDLKVADLKQELKRRDLTVSGSKPQLIERLREHQLKEMSANIPSVTSSTTSDMSYPSNISSVQSFSDDTFMAPPSVASVTSSAMASHISSPPQTPCSPMDDFLRSPLSVAPVSQGMETDESTGQAKKSTIEIVREQAKQIEVLQRQLSQYRQHYPIVQQPFVVSPTSASQTIASVSSTQQQIPAISLQQMQELMQRQNNQQQLEQSLQGQAFPQLQQHQQQQTTPIDITDKQVYVATPDGKMTAYKVILHTGNGIMQQMAPQSESSDLHSQNPATANSQMSAEQTVSPSNISTHDNGNPHGKDSMENVPPESEERNINVDDVIDVLIEAGEIDPRTMNNQPQKLGEQGGDQHTDSHMHSADSNTQQLTNGQPIDLDLHEQFSPLVDMDWIDSNSNSQYIHGLDQHDRPTLDNEVDGFMDNSNNELDWLSDVMHFDMQPSKVHSYDDMNTNSALPRSDIVMSPKPADLMNIFDLDESDFRATTESGSDFNWDKLISQSSHNF